MTKQPPAPAYIEDPLPLECAACSHPWPDDCACPHLTMCRKCGQPLSDPHATAAGYCSVQCFFRPSATATSAVM
jgi:hypothetical protein